MTKIAINGCYGGFSLSPRAIQRLAELEGRDCYFFRNPRNGDRIDFKGHEQITLEEAEGEFMWHAFDVEDPTPFTVCPEPWCEMPLEKRKAYSAAYEQHQINDRDRKRDDPQLVQVVEELGDAANGTCAELTIVEVPDDVEWEVQEYDGNEHIAEVHQTWS